MLTTVLVTMSEPLPLPPPDGTQFKVFVTVSTGGSPDDVVTLGGA